MNIWITFTEEQVQFLARMKQDTEFVKSLDYILADALERYGCYDAGAQYGPNGKRLLNDLRDKYIKYHNLNITK